MSQQSLTVNKVFEQIVEQIASSQRTGGCDGWLIDAKHYFGENQAWLASSAEVTNDPRCLLALKAVVAPTVESIVQLERILREIWIELCCPDFEATAFETYREASILHFATAGASSAITGRMIVSGSHYFELVRRKENRARRRLPVIPFDVDFSDLEQRLLNDHERLALEEECNWSEDKTLIPEILALVKRTEHVISVGKKQFLGSEISQDALRFNLDALCRTIVKISFGRTDVEEWRRNLLKIVHPSTRPWNRDAEAIWEMAEQEVPKLLPLIQKYQLENDYTV